MDTVTANKYITLMAGLFQFAQDEGLREDNPALSLALKPRPEEEDAPKRRPFTIDELNQYFSAPIFTGCKSDEEGWCPPGEPITLGTKIARHSKGNRAGQKARRRNIREVRKSFFTPLNSIEEVSDRLFGDQATASSPSKR